MNGKWIAGFFLLLGADIQAQNRAKQVDTLPQYDETYYVQFPQQLLGRFYFSQKYTRFRLPKEDGIPKLNYMPNTTLNMGVGATYKSFSLNLAYGFGFLNQDAERGKTKYLDLQSHAYSRKHAIDFFGQFYKGYYLSDFSHPSLSTPYYVRPDLRVRYGGLVYSYLFNGRKFSYSAAMIMNEWQKKSAGSFFLNASFYLGQVKGDSSFVPWMFQSDHPVASVQRVEFLQLGPGAGYAHTFVISQHFFCMGSVQTNLNMGYTKEYDVSNTFNQFAVRPAFSYRAAIGYNSRLWGVNLNWVSSRFDIKGDISDKSYRIETGNARLNISRRFQPGPRLQKNLNRIPFI